MERDEEVRRKPAPQVPVRREPANTSVGGNSDYYDILVIGKTGMGKSTTADKLMVPQTCVLGTKQRAADKQLIATSKEADKQRIRREKVLWDQRQRAKESDSSLEISVDEHCPNLQYEDLTAWVHCDDEEEQQKGDNRIKNIVFCRRLENSHEEVDELRRRDDPLYKSSATCQLLTNDTSRVRVLDIPGFHGADHFEGAKNPTDSNLAIVRKIIRIQATAGIKFRRVLYFLPEKGPLTRSDRIIQGEINTMVRYFGKSIFECMVLVTTVSPHFSLRDESRDMKFPPTELEKTREFFQEALIREFEDVPDVPQPPIIFISMTDTCEQILKLVTAAPVTNEKGLQLEFNPVSCIRCAMTIGTKCNEKGENIAMACAYDKKWSGAIPYDESTCHPKMLPRYTIRSIGKGIVRLFHFKWCFTEDTCVNPTCKKTSGTPGCKQVGSKFQQDGFEPIIVNHSYTLDSVAEMRPDNPSIP